MKVFLILILFSFGVFFNALFLAADGPGDRFIIGESQAGEQVSAQSDTHTHYDGHAKLQTTFAM